MKGGVTAAGCISKFLPPATSQPIWITDSLLEDAYHRFACGHRRHGSNVPGPLEARRRTAKRRNTGWAQLQSGQTSLEPAILFSKQSSGGWWQKSQPSEKPEAIPLLPSWLFPRELSLQPDSFFQTSHRPKHLEKTNKPSLSARAKQCYNVEDMRKLLCEHQINEEEERRNVLVTLFRHALKSRWPAQEIAKFLTEPTFNPSSTNFSKLLLHYMHDATGPCHGRRKQDTRHRYFCKKYTQPDSWQTLQTAFCGAAKLGFLSPQALQELVDELFACVSSIDNDAIARNIHQNLWDLLVSFEQSTLFRVQDLDQVWTSQLVSKLLTEPLTTPSTRLLSMLRDQDELGILFNQTVIHRLETQGPEVAESFLQSLSPSVLGTTLASITGRTLTSAAVQLLSRFKEEQEIVSLISGVFFDCLETSNMVKVKGFLAVLPHGAVVRILARVTTQCISSSRNGRGDVEMMALWEAFITSLQNPDLCSWLLEKPNFSMLCKCSSDQLSQEDRYLVALWILFRLCRSDGSRPTLLPDISEQLCLREELSELFPTTAETLGHVGVWEVRLSISQLPFGPAFAEELHILTSRDRLSSMNASVIVADAHAKASLNFSSLMDDELYRALSKTSIDVLGECGASVNMDLTRFGQLARRIVHSDKHALRIVKRVLRHNASQKNSLSQSWPQRIERHQNWDLRGRAGHSEEQDDKHIPPPVEALEAIERLALSFALSPVLKPRSAFTQVYWCYIFLHRYGAPITPAVSHALWHAGVVRYRGNGPALTQVRWILKIVAEVEGKGVARMLLWNSQYRIHRESLLKSLDAHKQELNQDQNQALKSQEVLLDEGRRYDMVSLKDQILRKPTRSK